LRGRRPRDLQRRPAPGGAPHAPWPLGRAPPRRSSPLERPGPVSMSDPDWSVDPLFEPFMATAERVARERPEVDLELSREVFHEAATLLHNGVALDGLDEHDAESVVAGVCEDLVAPDPGGAIRARAEAVLADPGELHDPEGA